MSPLELEVDQIHSALIEITAATYSENQFELMVRFLRSYGLNYHENEVNKLFSNRIPLLDAMNALHRFAKHYQNEPEIYEEYQEAVNDILLGIAPSECSVSLE